MADATGVCYTQSGDVKRYESDQGPTLGVIRNNLFGPITSDSFSLSYKLYGNICQYEVTQNGNYYDFPVTDSSTYLVVRYGGVDKKFGYKKKKEDIFFQVRYSLPIFEYGEDLRIGVSLGSTLPNCCYIPVSKEVPFCSYNEIDFNSYSSYIQGYHSDEEYGSILIHYNIPSNLLDCNIECTMFGPLEYRNSENIYGTNVTYNFTNKVNGMKEYVGATKHTTMSKRPTGAVDLPINLLDVAYFDNSSFWDSTGSVPYQELYYNKSLICNIGSNEYGKQGFKCYDMDNLKVGKYSYTAMNIYIPNSIAYVFSVNNNDTTYNFRCVLDKEYCNTFAYDPVNYYYKIYKGNIENIFVCEPDDYILSGTIKNGEIDSLYRMDFYVNNIDKGHEPIFYDDDDIEQTQEFTFTIQGSEINMKYKFINNFIKRYDYEINDLDNPDIDYNSILNVSSNIEFDRIYEGDNTFTITSNLFNKIEDTFDLGFEMVFYSGIGSKYIDIRKDQDTGEKKTLSVNFLWYACTGSQDPVTPPTKEDPVLTWAVDFDYDYMTKYSNNIRLKNIRYEYQENGNNDIKTRIGVIILVNLYFGTDNNTSATVSGLIDFVIDFNNPVNLDYSVPMYDANQLGFIESASVGTDVSKYMKNDYYANPWNSSFGTTNNIYFSDYEKQQCNARVVAFFDPDGPFIIKDPESYMDFHYEKDNS